MFKLWIRMKRIIVGAVILTLLNGCASTSAKRVHLEKLKMHPEYQVGFEDGCHSGYVTSGHPFEKYVKQKNLYKKNEFYKQGWDVGSLTCAQRFLDQPIIMTNLIP